MLTAGLAKIAVTIQIALALVVSPEPAAMPPDPALIDRLNAWLNANSDLPQAPDAPTIRLTDPSQVPPADGIAAAIGKSTRGLYEPGTSTIHLVRPWDADNPRHQSILLHEMVHHRQSGRHYYCTASREYEAYKLQETWLAENGHSLEINWIGVILASSCAPRDIHPD